MAHRALVIVDVQNDFVTGSLAVATSESILPIIKKLAESPDYEIVAATRDWHPVDHCSFIEQGGPWPNHCVAGTPGAVYAESFLITPGWHFLKGRDSNVEEYSCRALPVLLKRADISDVDVCGLAYDYCVKDTALDMAYAGFNVQVLLNATRAVTLDNIYEASRTMQDAGIKLDFEVGRQ